MNNKKTKKIALFLALIITLLPISVSAKEIEENSINKDITILNDDIYNLVYTQKTEEGLYKVVEHMTMDLKNVESDFYKLNTKTDKFEHMKHISSNISDGQILVDTTENDIITHEKYNIADYYDSTYNPATDEGSISLNAGKWNTGSRNGYTFIRNATISGIIQILGGLIGAAVGSIVGASGGGAIIGGGLATIAEKIIMRKVKTVRYKTTVQFRYVYPYYDYQSNTYFYDENNGYLGRSADSGRRVINM